MKIRTNEPGQLLTLRLIGSEDDGAVFLRNVIPSHGSQAVFRFAVDVDTVRVPQEHGGRLRVVAPETVHRLPHIIEVEGCALRNIGCQSLAKGSGVVGVNAGVVGCAGDGDIGQPVIDKRAAGLGVDIGDHAVGGESLRAVGRDGVAVVKKPELGRVEGDLAPALAVHADGDGALLKGRDGAEIAIGDAEIAVPGGELDSLTQTEVPAAIFKDIYPIEPLRIVGDLFAVLLLHGEGVGPCIHTDHAGLGIPLEAESLAAGFVTDHIAGVIERGPGASCTGEVGTMRERLERAAVPG